jgi:hypothetical protein
MRRGRRITIRRNSAVNWSISRVGNATILRVGGAGFGRKLSHGLNLIKKKEWVASYAKCQKNAPKAKAMWRKP